MASGVLGKLSPSGGNISLTGGATANDLFAATQTTTLIVSICNVSGADAKVTMAIVDTNATVVNAEDYIEYDYVLASNVAYERTGIVLANGQKIVVGSDAHNTLTFVAYGLES